MGWYGLVVKRTRRKKTIRTGASLPYQAVYPNQVWTIDFQEDALLGGRKVRILNILDEFTREWLAVVVGFSASAKTVMGTLLPLLAKRGSPLYLRSDNGGEFVAEDLKTLLKGVGAVSRFIEPGHPWQNGFIESFHGRLRDEFLDREVFVSLAETRVQIEVHRLWYNRERPHSRLGYLSPEEFHQAWRAKQWQEAVPPPGQRSGESTETRSD
jgi:putative transposase